MAFTREGLAKLEAAIQSGVLSVTDRGKTVTYQSLSDLIAAYELAKAAVEAAESGTPAPTRRGGIIRLEQSGRGFR